MPGPNSTPKAMNDGKVVEGKSLLKRLGLVSRQGLPKSRPTKSDSGNVALAVLATIGGIILLFAVVVGGWRLGWWMTAKSTDYQAHIYQHSYGTQSAYEEQLHQAITDIDGVEVQINDRNTPASEVIALRAQEVAMVKQACDIASKVTITLPSDETAWIAAHC